MQHLKLQKVFKITKKVVYFSLPVILLLVIIKRIDIQQLGTAIKSTNLPMYLLALCGYPFIIMLGAIRWHLLKKKLIDPNIPLGYSLKHYWVGLSIGYFAPGSVGWDIYKAAVAIKNYGNALKNIYIVLAEKFSGMIACVTLVMIFYPLIPSLAESDIFTQISHISNYVLYGFAIFILFIILFRGNNLFDRLLRTTYSNIKSTITHVNPKIGKFFDHESNMKLQGIFARRNIGTYILTLLLALSIQVTSSVLVFVFFRSIDVYVPLMVTIIITPVLFFVFLLPISFGSIGVREASYIFFYSFFGVAEEQALLISLFTLSGQVLTIIIGGIILQTSNFKNYIKQ